ncbi:MAG: hypothetical protein ACK5Q5_24950 [Planctomycetaceae bacterium]
MAEASQFNPGMRPTLVEVDTAVARTAAATMPPPVFKGNSSNSSSVPPTAHSVPTLRVVINPPTQLPESSAGVVITNAAHQEQSSGRLLAAPVVLERSVEPVDSAGDTVTRDHRSQPEDDSSQASFAAAIVRDVATGITAEIGSLPTSALRTPSIPLSEVIVNAVRDITPPGAKAESQIVRMEVHPPSYGPLTIEFERTSRGVALRVTSAVAQTHSLLNEGRHDLMQALGQMYVGEVVLDLAHSGGFGAGSRDDHQPLELPSHAAPGMTPEISPSTVARRSQHDLDRLA